MSYGKTILLTGTLTISLFALGIADHLLQGRILFREETEKEKQERTFTYVQQTLTQHNIAFKSVGETFLLQKLITETPPHTFTLLQNRDRIGAIAFVQTPFASTYLAALKETLSSSFSPEVEDLTDSTYRSQTGKPVAILQFRDPNIHPEYLLFGTTEESIYELHIPQNHQKTLQKLIWDLLELHN